MRLDPLKSRTHILLQLRSLLFPCRSVTVEHVEQGVDGGGAHRTRQALVRHVIEKNLDHVERVVAQPYVGALVTVGIEHRRGVVRALAVQIRRFPAGRDHFGDERVQALEFELGERMAVGDHMVPSAGGAAEPLDQVVALAVKVLSRVHPVIGNQHQRG